MKGKVALVSGGSRGIGAETVRLFAEAGARVVFSYRQARKQAEALAAECGGPDRCMAVEQELSTPADGHALVAAAVVAFGRLDVLVANHGVWPPEDASIAQMSEAQWRRTMAVNLDSVFGLVQAAVAQMDRQPPCRGEAPGHIVLISSTAGQRGEAYHADYAVTKGALISLTKSLSSELAPRGIRVNCVAPGWVATEMSAATLDDPEMGLKIVAGDSAGPGGEPERDCRAGTVSLHAAGWVHIWRGAQRERRGSAGWMIFGKREKRQMRRILPVALAALAAGSAADNRAQTDRRSQRQKRQAGARRAGRHGAGAGRAGLAEDEEPDAAGTRGRLFPRQARRAAPPSTGSSTPGRITTASSSPSTATWCSSMLGVTGWEVTYKGKAPLPQEQVDDYLRRRDHSIETVVKMWLNDPQTILVYEGQRLAERHLAEQVTLISADNEAVTILMDAQTHLPLRRSFQWRDPVYKDKNRTPRSTTTTTCWRACPRHLPSRASRTTT